MAQVTEALERLDGVLSVSAGWLSDDALVKTRGDRILTVEEIARVLPPPFAVKGLRRSP